MNTLERALRCDDFTKAIFMVMEALGITSGDVAAQAFSDLEDPEAEWAKRGFNVRRKMLQKWLEIELLYASV